jgi:transposase
MYKLFIGCDMSKSVFDVSIMEHNLVYWGQFSNDIEGFKKMLKEIDESTEVPLNKWMVCFENTGVYSKVFLEWLISKNIPCKEENALKISRSLGIRRGKNDKMDSKDICRYAYEKRDSIRPSRLTAPEIIKLKKLLSRRELLIKQKQAIIVSLKEQKLVLGSELNKLFSAQNEQLIRLYSSQIKELEEQIQSTIHQDDEMKNNDGLARSVVGIGPIISAYMIALTENYTCFTNSRQFASYGGVAPFPHGQSGKRKGKNKVSHLANKKIKSLLSMAVNTARMYDNEIRMYYERKLNEGKQKGCVINAIKNKLIHRVFAVVKRQTPYVRMMNYI